MIEQINKKNSFGHHPRKRFGQNFLQSPAVIHQIIDAMGVQPNDNVIEIGPGLGALTLPLLKLLPHLIAIEIDRDLHRHWQESPFVKQLDLLSMDALLVDYSQWGKGIRLIGNLPYNISTPLILHLLNYVTYIKDMHFMVQKEVAERLAALSGNKSYGRLSIMVQQLCEVTLLFDVPPNAFNPAPKVTSSVVRIQPYLTSPYDPVDRTALARVVAQAFGMRRKTLANNLKPLCFSDVLQSLSIDPTARPEQISIEEYIRLTHALIKRF